MEKLLFIGPIPPPLSGPELSMQEFLNSKLLNEKYNINFLKTNFRKKNSNKGKFGISMIFNFFKYFIRLIKILISKKPHLVYYPITPTMIGWVGRDIWTILISKVFGCKVLIHLRGSHFSLNFEEFNKLVKILVAFSLKKVDHAIVQANCLRNQFEPNINPKNVSVLYQSMNFELFKPFKSKTNSKINILTVGHMTNAKGFNDVIKVIPKVAQKYPNVIFNFAGELRTGERGVFFNQFSGKRLKYEDPVKAERQIMNSKFSKNYKNLGLINGAVKSKIFNQCDIFLSASYSEGFSRSLLEAMAFAKPIVFTPVGAHREVYSINNGNFFEPGNISMLENAILNLIEDINREKIGKSNRIYAKSNFNVEKICLDFSKIINKVIKL